MFNSKILSLDIGSKNTKIVLGNQGKKNIIIEKAITMPTPLGGYNDGHILDITKFKTQLHEILESEKIKCKNIIITSKSTSIITRDIEVPMPKKQEELTSIIQFQMERYLPIMFDDFIMQYKVLEEFEEESIKKAKVSVIVYPKNMAEGYFNLVKELKGNAVALDISSNSVNKLFIENVNVNGENYSLQDTVAVIDLGFDFIDVNIVSGGNIEFTRLITYGGSHIDVDIAKQLFISEEEAEKQKLEACYLDRESYGDMQETLANDIAKSQVKIWIQEIERMINYYKNKEKGNKVQRIYIHGGSASINGIERFMKNALNIQVNKIETLSNVNFSKVNDDLSKYLNAIGAIVRLK